MKIQRGFSLLEAVAAFAVVALALAAVAQVVAQAARRAALVQDTAYALDLAQAKLAEQAAEPAEAGAAGEGERGTRWRRIVEPLLSAAEAEQAGAEWIPCRVSVEVRWGAGREERSLSLVTIRLRRRA